MSKAITIQQKGVAQNITVDKLQVHKAGGTAYWVPEETVELHALIATANGEYSAASAGYYGYGYASVSVPGSSVTGTGSDGNQHVITTDGSGAIVDTKVPSEIRITTPPTKTTYTDGETIDYTGIVVKAYYEDGGVWGTVPYNELVFPVTTADAQQQNEWSDGAGLNAALITYSSTWNRKINRGVETENQVYAHTTALGTDRYGRPASLGGDGPATLYVTKYDNELYASKISGDNRFDLYSYFNGSAEPYGDEIYGWSRTGGAGYTTQIGVFTHAPWPWNEYITNVPVSTVDPTTVTPSNLHAVQSLPVNWARPGDGAILETSFYITVQQSLGGATGGGGEAGESGAGRND